MFRIESARQIRVFVRLARATASPSETRDVAIAFQARYRTESILVSPATGWKFDGSRCVACARAYFRFHCRPVAGVERFLVRRNAPGYSRLHTFRVTL